MSSILQAKLWLTARALHQIQLLSCDYVLFKKWKSTDLSAPFWRLYWHDRPGCTIVLAERRIRIPARRFILIPPNTRFACDNAADFGQLFLHFRLEPGVVGTKNKIYQIKPSAELNRIAGDLSKALAADPGDLKISLSAQSLVATALMHVPKTDWGIRYEDARITETTAAIRTHYPRKTSNTALAQKAGLHPGAFLRLFRQNTGHTPGEFLANLRMEEACVLLQCSNLSIEEIAEKTGFCDRAYFSRFFTHRIGMAPAGYRNLVNSDNRLRK